MKQYEYQTLAVILDGLILEAVHYSTLAREARSTRETIATLHHIEPRLEQAINICRVMQALNRNQIVEVTCR